MQARAGPKSGTCSPASIRSASPASPPRAQLRAGAAAGQLAVQEHRQLELRGQPVGEHQRLGAGGTAIGVVEVDDRRDVDRAHARVDALVADDVDLLDRDLARR